MGIKYKIKKLQENTDFFFIYRTGVGGTPARQTLSLGALPVVLKDGDQKSELLMWQITLLSFECGKAGLELSSRF